MKILCIFFTLLFGLTVQGQNKIAYTLRHSPSNHTIEIEITFPPISAEEVALVIPRSAPGTYSLTNYQAFVDHVLGYTESGKTLDGQLGIGSFFTFEGKEEMLAKVSYQVDLEKMETQLLDGGASSKSRTDYLGVLGYSVFGFVEGLETQPISLTLKTDATWPIFSTLAPTLHRPMGSATFEIEDFGILADAQFMLGNAARIYQVEGSPIPLFVAIYSETEVDLEEIGRRGLLALNGLKEYFGYIPMPHYTIYQEFIHPISDRHDYGFSMEHLNSMTFTGDLSRAVKNYDANANIGGIVHHMGHSWVPLRSYGTGYRPFAWQLAPLIETIWLNEGFTWYISYYHILQNPKILEFFNRNMDEAPNFIKEKSLKDLSLLGSSQYAADFRIGRNLFSRGALFAHDLDMQIQKETEGKKSFKDAILGLLHWTETHQRAFEYDEIEPIMSKATGVDLSDVWNQWQEPREK
ncbi:hypothetical protein [Flagellimonas aequoris]|nr:hypothetical protein [Allomuricauda aequoris]TXK07451.1 hypothetical protein FQ019_01610 [Allomuricauda aequoris]